MPQIFYTSKTRKLDAAKNKYFTVVKNIGVNVKFCCTPVLNEKNYAHIDD